jgi:(2Fe-2S) ferredoxin
MKYENHIFICVNERLEMPVKKSCSLNGLAIRQKFVEELKKNDLFFKVRANKSGCLGLCNNGPIVVIYPEGIWYSKVTIEDVPIIIKETIINKRVIKRLLVN